MSERDDLAAALRRCVPDGTWLEAATRLLASDWLAAHDADVRRAPVVDQPEHTVAWQDKANIICGCGQVFSHDYGKSPAPILGSTSDYYLRTHCGTLYARHLRDVRTTNAADVRRASVVDREALAHDLHDYGVCRELRWDGAGHDEAPPCDVLASHIIVFLASGAVQDAADVRRAVAEEVIERVCAACLSLVAILKGEDGVPLHAIPLAEFNEAVDRIAREAATDPTEAT